MSTQHTPGPWFVDTNTATATVRAASGTSVARCYQGDIDARLIAAAPTMLATLQTVLESMGDTYEARDNDGESLHDLVESTIHLATKA